MTGLSPEELAASERRVTEGRRRQQLPDRICDERSLRYLVRLMRPRGAVTSSKRSA
jgi:hypothetical protein